MTRPVPFVVPAKAGATATFFMGRRPVPLELEGVRVPGKPNRD